MIIWNVIFQELPVNFYRLILDPFLKYRAVGLSNRPILISCPVLAVLPSISATALLSPALLSIPGHPVLCFLYWLYLPTVLSRLSSCTITCFPAVLSLCSDHPICPVPLSSPPSSVPALLGCDCMADHKYWRKIIFLLKKKNLFHRHKGRVGYW